MAFKVEKQTSKLVKPFVSTPSTLCQYKIGFTDEFTPVDLSTPIILFFPKNNNHNEKFVVQLEKSLEKALTTFYPLAGRYVENIQTINCNDEGAEFIHANVNITLQDFLGIEENVNLVDEFIPSKTRVATDPLLGIQVTTFECGGVAIGISASHIIVDASTLCTFVNQWAAMNREENLIEFGGPRFITSSLFPGRGQPPIRLPPMSEDSKYTRKKLSFSKSEVLNMKVKAIVNGKDSTQQYWSKVQLVYAVISKALIVADRAIHNNPRDFILIQPVNLREKTACLIPKQSCGNICTTVAVQAGILETTKELADRLSDSVKKTINKYAKVYLDSEEGKMMILNTSLEMSNDFRLANVIMLSSWCKFPFYEADFGFGKPIWVAPGTIPIEHFTLLMDDSEGNGVEAYVFMKIKDVPYFEEALDINGFGA